MSFAAFHIRLSEQMIGYNLALNVYPGDKSFRESSQVHKGRRNSDEDRDQDHID
jgi:hypothetical protein